MLRLSSGGTKDYENTLMHLLLLRYVYYYANWVRMRVRINSIVYEGYFQTRILLSARCNMNSCLTLYEHKI